MYYAMSGGEEMMSMPATEPETMSEQPMQVEALPAETATPAIVEPAETTPVPESIESIEIDPAAERENLLSLLEDIDALIDDGGDDAQAWQDIKILLEQTLVDMGDTTNDPNSI
jgi:hypothetical protein